MRPASFADRAEMARITARTLLDIGAVSFNAKEPFTHASGKTAPTTRLTRELNRVLNRIATLRPSGRRAPHRLPVRSWNCHPAI